MIKTQPKDYSSKQLNLKISQQLYEEAHSYAKQFGYTNIQELIKEAIRDKVFEKALRDEYLEEIQKNPNFQKSIGKKESIKSLEQLKQRANE